MKIAVIGGGFTGLTAAYELSKMGHAVTLFERNKTLGGLAYGFRQKNWDWHLEYAYHHLFTNDHAILSLIKELGLEKKLMRKRPITANYYKGKMYQLDSPLSLLQLPLLSATAKIRTAFLLGFLKINPFWRPLEHITAEQLLCTIGGKYAYKILWEPLLYGKFGHFAPTISAAWFWARIKKRTPSLFYIEGGFQTLVNALEKAIKKNGGKIYTGKTLTSLPAGFDKTLLTVPTPIAQKLMPKIIDPHIPHLWAQTLILETDKPILEKVYWLNITDKSFPFLAVVAHTNLTDKSHYGNHHITYFGNYLPNGHPFLSLNKDQLLKKFLPYIKKINPSIICDPRPASPAGRSTISYLFTAPYAQPVHGLHYSQKIPQFETPVPNVYLANMDSIVPWDRGTNYAVELGIKSAKKIISLS